jgi:cyclopropane fatty-acyl-phospholipid synthase-like methyltransferase
MDAEYIERKTIGGLAPEIEDDRSSGFRAVIKRLAPPKSILEIGCLDGAWTTIHLLDVFPDVTIDIVEVDKKRADAAAANPLWQGRVRVQNLDARDFHPRTKFDLIIIDLQYGAIGFAYEVLLPYLAQFLSERGGVFLYTLYDIDAAYEGIEPSESRGELEAFMLRYFGSTVLDLQTMQRRMIKHGFAALALVDRQMLKGWRKGHGFAYLEKLPTS